MKREESDGKWGGGRRVGSKGRERSKIKISTKKRSSPVLVTKHGDPLTSVRAKFEKNIFDRSTCGAREDSTSAALGPWSASSERSSWTVIETSPPLALKAVRCLFRCFRSLSLQPALTTR